MKNHGLKVQGDRGETHLMPIKATDNPADRPVDIVLFCVQLWDVESAGVGIFYAHDIRRVLR